MTMVMKPMYMGLLDVFLFTSPRVWLSVRCRAFDEEKRIGSSLGSLCDSEVPLAGLQYVLCAA